MAGRTMPPRPDSPPVSAVQRNDTVKVSADSASVSSEK